MTKTTHFTWSSVAGIAAITFLTAASLLFTPTTAVAKDIELPGDGTLWRPSALPGYQLTLQNCSACHSAHYAEYQPPNTSPAYWQATVVKMQKVFKAPISDSDISLIVEYLNQTYGEKRK